MASCIFLVPHARLQMRPLQQCLGGPVEPVSRQLGETAATINSSPAFPSLVDPPNQRDERDLAPSASPSSGSGNGCIPTRLGGAHEWSPNPRFLVGQRTFLPYQLAGAQGSPPGPESFSTLHLWQLPSCSDGQYHHVLSEQARGHKLETFLWKRSPSGDGS